MPVECENFQTLKIQDRHFDKRYNHHVSVQCIKFCKLKQIRIITNYSIVRVGDHTVSTIAAIHYCFTVSIMTSFNSASAIIATAIPSVRLSVSLFGYTDSHALRRLIFSLVTFYNNSQQHTRVGEWRVIYSIYTVRHKK